MKNWSWWQAVRIRHAWRVLAWRARWAAVRALSRAGRGSKNAMAAAEVSEMRRAERIAIAKWYRGQAERLTPAGEELHQWRRKLDATPRDQVRPEQDGEPFAWLGYDGPLPRRRHTPDGYGTMRGDPYPEPDWSLEGRGSVTPYPESER